MCLIPTLSLRVSRPDTFSPCVPSRHFLSVCPVPPLSLRMSRPVPTLSLLGPRRAILGPCVPSCQFHPATFSPCVPPRPCRLSRLPGCVRWPMSVISHPSSGGGGGGGGGHIRPGRTRSAHGRGRSVTGTTAIPWRYLPRDLENSQPLTEYRGLEDTAYRCSMYNLESFLTEARESKHQSSPAIVYRSHFTYLAVSPAYTSENLQ